MFTGEKEYNNLLMILITAATWARIMGIFLVNERISSLLITIFIMITEAGPFVMLNTMIFMIESFVFMTIFQEQSISYYNLTATIRTLFDGLMGNNYYEITPFYTQLHSVLMVVHIYLSNIFLLNYLVAILGSVYENMLEKASFVFKSYKYKFIERYYIAFQDQWGYSELIVHAPPLNLILVLLMPSLFKPDVMLKTSAVISKLFFWFDNIFYIVF